MGDNVTPIIQDLLRFYFLISIDTMYCRAIAVCTVTKRYLEQKTVV